jgi:hypothetical protein
MISKRSSRFSVGSLSAIAGLATSLATGLAASQSHAQVTVQLWESGNPTPQSQTFGAGASIDLGAIPTNVTRVNVFSSGALVNVGSVTFTTGSRSSQLDVFLGQGSMPTSSTELTAAAADFGGLSLAAGAQQWIRFAGSASGDVGLISAGEVVRLEGGSLSGGINSIGNVDFVRLTGSGNALSSSIVSSNGAIGDISLTGGSVGNSGGVRPSILAADGVRTIIAQGSIDATVNANTNGGVGDIFQMIAQTGVIGGTVDARAFATPAGSTELARFQSGSSSLSFFSSARIQVQSFTGVIACPSGLTGPGAGVFVTGDFAGRIVSQFGAINEIIVGGNFTCAPSLCSSANRILAPVIGRIRIGGRLGEPTLPDYELAYYVAFSNFVDEVDIGTFYGRFPAGARIAKAEVRPFFATLQNRSFRSEWWVDENTQKATFTGDLLNEGLYIYGPGLLPTASLYIDEPVGIDLFAPGALLGQIIAGARTPTAIVRVEQTGPTSFAYTLTPDGYSTLPAVLGGGAFGAAPFEPHVLSSDNLNTTNGGVLNSAFNGLLATNRDAIIDFYGPVEEANPNYSSMRIEMLYDGVPSGVDLSPRVDFEVDPAQPRHLRMRGKPGYGLPAGTYLATPNANANLLTDGLLSSTPMPIDADTTYTFTLGQDCDADGIADSVESFTGVMCDGTGLCDPIDFNNDGVFPDLTDVFAFLDVFAGGACAGCNDVDFNNDGVWPDNSDIDIFINVYSGAPCPS